MSDLRPSSQQPGRPSAASLRLGLFGLFVGILLARVVYVSLFAEDLPFWDQWDAQIDSLLRPWTEGTWRPSDLFDYHNEHRIALARLLTLALFSLNGGHWDNLVEAYFNAGIYAAIYLLLCALLCRNEPDRRVRAATLAFALAIAVLPFGWENALVGVQSVFLLLVVIAIGMIAVAVYRPTSPGSVSMLCLLGIASLFTVASGVLSSVAVVAVILMRHWRDRLRMPFLLAVVMCMGLITAAGLALIPDLRGGDPLKAVGIGGLLSAALVTPMWPLQPLLGSGNWLTGTRLAFAIILWAPSLVWLVRFYLLRKADDCELFAGGIVVWVALQAVAIAHSRGNGMTALASRYMDFAAIGLLVNAWFAVRLACLPYRAVFTSLPNYAVALAFFAAATWGLAVRTSADLQQMRSRHQLVLLQKENVRDYLSTGEFSHLQQPRLGIPYRNPNGLRALLDNPVIRAMLPASIRDRSAPTVSGAGAGIGAEAGSANEFAVTAPIDSGRLSMVAHGIQDAIRRLFHARRSAMGSAMPMDSAMLEVAEQTPSACVLEAINSFPMADSTHVKSGSAINLSGWVIASNRTSPPHFALILRGANAYRVDSATGISRPDVAKALGSDAAATAGFSANVKLSGVATGIYPIMLLVPGPRGNELCDTRRKLAVSR